MAEKKQTLFEQLFSINVNDKVEKKANLSYLSWAWAWAEVKKIDENATVTIHEFPLPDNTEVKVPYLQTSTGFYVKVTVEIKGRQETEWLPVMDHRNKAMMNPTAFEVNKAQKRCMVKAIGLHGLGLYIYSGEDLPEEDKKRAEEEKKKANEPVPATENMKKLIFAKAGELAELYGNDKSQDDFIEALKAKIGFDSMKTVDAQRGTAAVKMLDVWINNKKQQEGQAS